MAQGICATTLKRKFQMKPFVLKQHARNAAAIRELDKTEVSAVAGGIVPSDGNESGGGASTYDYCNTYFLGIRIDRHACHWD